MPNMNELEASRDISQALPGLPIVLHTMYVSNILEVEAENKMESVGCYQNGRATSSFRR